MRSAAWTKELFRRVAERRDEEAFRLLYARHSAPVYGLCRLAGRNGDASDLLQETWLRAVRHLSLFRGPVRVPHLADRDCAELLSRMAPASRP